MGGVFLGVLRTSLAFSTAAGDVGPCVESSGVGAVWDC